VVRHHVAQGAGNVVELAASLDVKGFGNGNLDMVDVISIPQRLEYAVREPKHHDVLNCLLSEIVVDAIDLALVQYAENLAIERLRRGQIGPERLLDDDAPPMPIRFADEACISQPVHDGGKHLWGRREVEQDIAAGVIARLDRGQKLGKVLVGRRIVEITLEIRDVRGEPIPVVLRHLAVAELAQADAEVAPERLIVLFGSGDADHGKLVRQQPCLAKIVECRDQQAFREVSGPAEDHQDARIRGFCIGLYFH